MKLVFSYSIIVLLVLKNILNKDVGMPKPKRYANKVRMVLTQEVNTGLRIKQITSI